MHIRYFWLWSLFFTVSINALSSSSSHHTSTTKKSTSSHHTSTTTKKTTSSTKKSSSFHHTTTATTTKKSSSTSTIKSTTSSPTPTLSTFYLVAENTTYPAYNGVYLHEDPDLEAPGYPFMYLNPSNKTPAGAATFNLLPNGTLQYNGASGPQFACVSDGHPQPQEVAFGYANQLDEFDFDQLLCRISGAGAGAVTCLSAQTGADTFYFYAPNGGNVSLNIYEQVDGSAITLTVVLV